MLKINLKLKVVGSNFSEGEKVFKVIRDKNNNANYYFPSMKNIIIDIVKKYQHKVNYIFPKIIKKEIKKLSKLRARGKWFQNVDTELVTVSILLLLEEENIQLIILELTQNLSTKLEYILAVTAEQTI